MRHSQTSVESIQKTGAEIKLVLRVAIDTNCFRDLRVGDRDTMKVLESIETLVMPFVVLGELRAGFAHGTRAFENERDLRDFLQQPGVETLYADEATTSQYGALYHQLRLQGTPIPVNDLWIAALVAQHNLVLYTRDAHFRHLPQVAPSGWQFRRRYPAHRQSDAGSTANSYLTQMRIFQGSPPYRFCTKIPAGWQTFVKSLGLMDGADFHARTTQGPPDRHRLGPAQK